MKDVATAIFRALTFRLRPEDVERFGWRHFLVGMLCVWIAGIGRRWDDPAAEPWLRAGLFSLAYAVVLAWLLLGFSAALLPRFWSYRTTLTFVAFTAPLAWLYAIPVERWMPAEEAVSWNLWFLFVVALWRVAAYSAWLHRVQGFAWSAVIPAVALPLTCIVVALSFLNLEHTALDVMGGLRSERPAADAAYEVVVVLSVFSVLTLPLWLGWYMLAIAGRQKLARAQNASMARSKSKCATPSETTSR